MHRTRDFILLQGELAATHLLGGIEAVSEGASQSSEGVPALTPVSVAAKD